MAGVLAHLGRRLDGRHGPQLRRTGRCFACIVSRLPSQPRLAHPAPGHRQRWMWVLYSVAALMAVHSAFRLPCQVNTQ